MINEFDIKVTPKEGYNKTFLRQYLSKTMDIDVQNIYDVRILKRSIDARRRHVWINLKVRVYVNEFPQEEGFKFVDYQDVSSKPQVLVIGEGPGGLFASLKLIELGFRPIILERGKDVRERKRILQRSKQNNVSTLIPIIALVKEGQALIRMANFTRGLRNAEASKRY